MRWTRKFTVSLLLLGLLSMLTGATSPGRGAYSAGKYALELDGVIVGWLVSGEGGHAYADVVTEQSGPDYLVKKHIGNVKYEDITIKVSTGMSKAFYNWLADFMTGRSPRKSGSIIATDFSNRELQRLSFTNALITEVSFPALDAASKDAAYLTVKLTPEMTRQSLGKGATVRVPGDAKAQKKWLPSNFRLKIDGLDAAAARVNKIEAITVKQRVSTDNIGEMRDYEQEPAGLEIPNLVITFPESHASDFLDYFEDFVIRGNAGQDQEKSGSLEFLSQDRKDVLFRLELRNLGIFKLTPDKVESGAEQIRRVKAEMYCEDVRFTFGTKATQ